MKYFLKAITTNNRDLKTSIYLSFDERAYLFNVPDGFQRMALNQKMKFNKVRYIFLSSLSPDHYAGFPGFYLSAREACGSDLQNFRVSVFGPKNLRKLIKKGSTFYSNVSQLEIFEYSGMTKPFIFKSVDGSSFEFTPKHTEMEVDQQEEKKIFSSTKSDRSDSSVKEDAISPTHAFNDNFLTIIPVKIGSSDERDQSAFSFICIPKQDRGKFLPKKAVELGCNPKVHFRLLAEG
jgi:ribonuclease Z